MRSSPTSRLDTWRRDAPGYPTSSTGWMRSGEKRGWFETPNCKKKPSDYIKGGNVYIHAEPGEELIPEVIRVMGKNRLFYASDWPHWDNEYPDSLYHIWQREDLTEEQKRGILRDNAVEMYGLENGG